MTRRLLQHARFAAMTLALVSTAARADAPPLIFEVTPGGAPARFSPNGALLTGGSTAPTLLSTTDGSTARAFARIRGGSPIAYAFSPNGALLAVGTAGLTLNFAVYRLSDGAQLWLTTGHANGTKGIAFSPDGSLIATTGPDRFTRVWRASDGTPVRAMSDGVRMAAVAWSPDGTLIASGNTGAVHLWRAADGALVRTIASAGAATGLAFSPDGKSLATADALFDVASGALVRRFTWPSPDGTPIAVAFSRDGSKLITTGEDFQYPTIDHGAVRVWNVSTGALLATYDQATGTYVNSVAVSPDGTELAWSFIDATAGGTVLAHFAF